MVEIVILVITRWHDSSNRMSLRNTLGSKIKANHQNTKLIFVLGVPENATDLQKEQIVEENMEDTLHCHLKLLNQHIYQEVSPYLHHHQFLEV